MINAHRRTLIFGASAALALGDVPHEDRCAVPVGRRRIEDPREGVADGRSGKSIGHAEDRDRQQQADQHGNRGDLPMVGVGNRSGQSEFRLA